MKRIILIGDYNPSVIAHEAIPKAIALAAPNGQQFQTSWLPTTKVKIEKLREADAIWCVPGSPYESMEGALAAIRYARENNVPFLGTCGGFQHALIEYARNVLGVTDADHTESNPETTMPVICKLKCSLINQSEKVRIVPNSRLAQIYDKWTIVEGYQCSYGLNPDFQERLGGDSLRFTAFSDELGVRAFEHADHPFFIGTLFQPERSAKTGVAHPLITALVEAAAGKA